MIQNCWKFLLRQFLRSLFFVSFCWPWNAYVVFFASLFHSTFFDIAYTLSLLVLVRALDISVATSNLSAAYSHPWPIHHQKFQRLFYASPVIELFCLHLQRVTFSLLWIAYPLWSFCPVLFLLEFFQLFRVVLAIFWSAYRKNKKLEC